MTTTLKRAHGAAPRVQRSKLAVPATSEHLFVKAAGGAADSVFLDLEDGVADQLRTEARAKAVLGLTQIDWGTKLLAARINALGTRWALRDILDIAGCERLDTVLVPKVEIAEDVVFVDRLLSALEAEHPRERPLGIEVIVETARGLANVEAIAASSPRLESIIFGAGDYSIELGTFDTEFGAANGDYAVLAREDDAPPVRHWNDQWHFARARIANACRAHGLAPIDAAYTNYGDGEGFRASCRAARALGFEGKCAIHPSQVLLANEAFSPRPEQVRWARAIAQRMEEADAAGLGAIGADGLLIDRAHVKLARNILQRAMQVEPSGRGKA